MIEPAVSILIAIMTMLTLLSTAANLVAIYERYKRMRRDEQTEVLFEKSRLAELNTGVGPVFMYTHPWEQQKPITREMVECADTLIRSVSETEQFIAEIEGPTKEQ